jgi:hypothetical protein
VLTVGEKHFLFGVLTVEENDFLFGVLKLGRRQTVALLNNGTTWFYV